MIHHSIDDLDIDIALKNRSGQSYEADTEIYVVVYGVAGTQNDVDVRLWDRYFILTIRKFILKPLLIWLIRILKMSIIYQ